MSEIFITEDGERKEATGKALEEILAFQAADAAERKAAEAKAKADAAAKQAILDRLGLTADEAALLLK